MICVTCRKELPGEVKRGNEYCDRFCREQHEFRVSELKPYITTHHRGFEDEVAKYEGRQQ